MFQHYFVYLPQNNNINNKVNNETNKFIKLYSFSHDAGTADARNKHRGTDSS